MSSDLDQPSRPTLTGSRGQGRNGNRTAYLTQLETIDHYLQWTHAIRGAAQTSSHFDYAGPLTETVLLGTIAARFADRELLWNSSQLEFSNEPQANAYVRQEYRRGWQVEGL